MLPDKMVFREIIPSAGIHAQHAHLLAGVNHGGRLVLPGLRPISSGTQGELTVLEDPLARQWQRRGGGPPPDGPHGGSAGMGVS